MVLNTGHGTAATISQELCNALVLASFPELNHMKATSILEASGNAAIELSYLSQLTEVSILHH
ncbi:hypothetical protein K461DRAFT_277669 [Myriangium duriaei CBS 260.36]|uniref:Uncharacterized protein n=1 Tax=Myriangium duriaei CBS 260.36 TaxID=1168546 RepID=A0A9P4MH63_9PEZI|nr:hypothetical protein K461DRAFT_277669 [Myriangium duriaei CBS 260.36]